MRNTWAGPIIGMCLLTAAIGGISLLSDMWQKARVGMAPGDALALVLPLLVAAILWKSFHK